MVGGLADWFAVTALFRHPLGLRIPHTALVPRKKDELAQKLGEFVTGNFLTADVVARHVAEAGLVRRAGERLADPATADSLAARAGGHAGRGAGFRGRAQPRRVRPRADAPRPATAARTPPSSAGCSPRPSRAGPSTRSSTLLSARPGSTWRSTGRSCTRCCGRSAQRQGRILALFTTHRRVDDLLDAARGDPRRDGAGRTRAPAAAVARRAADQARRRPVHRPRHGGRARRAAGPARPRLPGPDPRAGPGGRRPRLRPRVARRAERRPRAAARPRGARRRRADRHRRGVRREARVLARDGVPVRRHPVRRAAGAPDPHNRRELGRRTSPPNGSSSRSGATCSSSGSTGRSSARSRGS